MSLIAQGLVKEFGYLRAVDGVSFKIAGPGIVGMIGPNGAGKSTILRMLTTFLAPDAGSAIVAGFDCRNEQREVRRRLGYLPESTPEIPEARIEELLSFRAILKGIPRRDRRREIDRCLQLCGLKNVRRRLIGNLSHGYKRRVALADALLGDPPVMILDEPTSGFDPLQVRQFRELLSELATNHTILLSTHTLTEAEASCDRVLILSAGRLVDDVDLSDANETVCHLEVAGPVVEIAQHLDTIAGVTKVETYARTDQDWQRFKIHGASSDGLSEEVGNLCLQQGWKLRELSHGRVSLEERFVRSMVTEQRRAA